MPTAPYPTPLAGSWTATDVAFNDGSVLPALRLRYMTVGDPGGEPVLLLHGSNGSSASLLTPQFAGALFGPGQALDARRYYIVIPDALGSGDSSKPSDGLRAAFPHYDYADMVELQRRLLVEHLGVTHVRLVLGYSMGGMHAWLWATRYPGLMDAVVALAALPTEVAGRNWIMRRMIIDAVRHDPAWRNGDYTEQPRAFRHASVYYGLATSGGSQALHLAAPTREAADRLLDARLAAPFVGDANDHLYQWEAARHYNAAPDLEKITATLLAINSVDDERNPPELGLLERELRRVPHGQMLLLPGDAEEHGAGLGHATLTQAARWAEPLRALLASAPVCGPA
jgi:homoserine O-acetyltransferase